MTVTSAATRAVIIPNMQNSTVGSPVSFALQLAVPAAAAAQVPPAGTVDFRTSGGAVVLGSSSKFTLRSIADNTAIYIATVHSTTAGLLAAGTHIVNATFTPSDPTKYPAPTSIAPATLTLDPGAQTIDVDTMATPIEFGQLPQAYTLLVTVPDDSAPGPTGSLSMTIDNAAATITSGTYLQDPSNPNEYRITVIYHGQALKVGRHKIAFTAAADSNYTRASTTPEDQVVEPAPVAMSFPTVTPNPSNEGDRVSYHVTLSTSVAAGTPNATGSVLFTTHNRSTGVWITLGSLQIAGSGNSYSASLTTAPPLPGGIYDITATFVPGDGNYATSGATAFAAKIVNSAMPTTMQAVVAGPILGVSFIRAPSALTPGTSTVFTIQVSNTGSVDEATGFLQESLPTGTTFNANLSSAGWNPIAPDSFQLALPTIPAGGSITVRYAVSTSATASAGPTSATATVFDSRSTDPLASATINLSVVGGRVRWPRS